MHYKKNGKVNGSLIQNKELVAGCLSVWRIDAFDDFTLNSVVAEVQSKLPSAHLLKEIFAVKAKIIRAIRVKEVTACRALCVVDDTSTNRSGGTHKAHAAIGVCRELTKRGFDKDDERFHGIKERLLSELTKDRVWTRPQA